MRKEHSMSTVTLRAAEPTPSDPMQINTEAPHAFETSAFKGRLALWIAGLSGTPSELFAGKKRKTQFVVQVARQLMPFFWGMGSVLTHH